MEKTNMKIVLGYDGSKPGKAALVVAKMHARPFNAKVYVLTCMVKGNEDQQLKIEEAEDDLKYVQSYLETEDIECETHLLFLGLTAGEQLVQFAEENHVDEIVVGVKRRSRVGM